MAICAMTRGAAYSAFGEEAYGSLRWATSKLHRLNHESLEHRSSPTERYSSGQNYSWR
jgi:hypothetical protein